MSPQRRSLRIIRTHEPEEETWSMLSYFESSYNSEQYLKKKFGASVDKLNETATSLALHMKAAREYFRAADSVSILTKPLLLFYGMTALSKALFMSTHAKESPSRGHGLHDVEGWNGIFSDFSVRIQKDGTFPQFHGCFSKESLRSCEFSLKELFSLIPEVKVNFETVYDLKSRALKVEHVKYGISIVDSELQKYENLESLVAEIPHVSERYMKTYQRANGKLFLYCANADAQDPIIRAISGEEYIVLPIKKGSTVIVVPEMSVHFLTMYCLGMISRYPLKEWGKTISGGESGEIYIVQKFLEVTKRKFPNLVLNELRDRTFMFSNPSIETEGKMSEDQLKDIYEYVKNELNRDLRSYM